MQAVPTALSFCGVAFLAFSTESSHGVRADWSLLDDARALRRRGIPSVLLQLHLHATDEAENRKRVDSLVARVRTGRFWVGRVRRDVDGRLLGALRSSTRACASLSGGRSRSTTAQLSSIAPRPSIRGVCDGSPSLTNTTSLVEVLRGQPTAGPVKNVTTWAIGHACSFQGGLIDNPFFAELASEPDVREAPRLRALLQLGDA